MQLQIEAELADWLELDAGIQEELNAAINAELGWEEEVSDFEGLADDAAMFDLDEFDELSDEMELTDDEDNEDAAGEGALGDVEAEEPWGDDALDATTEDGMEDEVEEFDSPHEFDSPQEPDAALIEQQQQQQQQHAVAAEFDDGDDDVDVDAVSDELETLELEDVQRIMAQAAAEAQASSDDTAGAMPLPPAAVDAGDPLDDSDLVEADADAFADDDDDDADEHSARHAGGALLGGEFAHDADEDEAIDASLLELFALDDGADDFADAQDGLLGNDVLDIEEQAHPESLPSAAAAAAEHEAFDGLDALDALSTSIELELAETEGTLDAHDHDLLGEMDAAAAPTHRLLDADSAHFDLDDIPEIDLGDFDTADDADDGPSRRSAAARRAAEVLAEPIFDLDAAELEVQAMSSMMVSAFAVVTTDGAAARRRDFAHIEAQPALSMATALILGSDEALVTTSLMLGNLDSSRQAAPTAAGLAALPLDALLSPPAPGGQLPDPLTFQLDGNGLEGIAAQFKSVVPALDGTTTTRRRSRRCVSAAAAPPQPTASTAPSSARAPAARPAARRRRRRSRASAASRRRRCRCRRSTRSGVGMSMMSAVGSFASAPMAPYPLLGPILGAAKQLGGRPRRWRSACPRRTSTSRSPLAPCRCRRPPAASRRCSRWRR